MTDRQKAYQFLLGAVVFFHAMTTLSYLGAFGYLSGPPAQAPATPRRHRGRRFGSMTWGLRRR